MWLAGVRARGPFIVDRDPAGAVCRGPRGENDIQTRMKILPSHNFVGGRKNETHRNENIDLLLRKYLIE